MKNILFVVLILIAATYSTPINSTFINYSPMYEALFNFINAKCDGNFTEADSAKFVDTAPTAYKCITSNYDQLLQSPQQFPETFKNCFNFTYLFEDECYQNTFEEILDLNVNITTFLVNFLIKNIDTFRSFEFLEFMQNCSDNVNLPQVYHEFVNCSDSYKLPSTSLDKKVYCQMLIEIETCAFRVANLYCSTTDVINKLKLDFFETLKDFCSEHLITENSQEEESIGGLFTLLARLIPQDVVLH